MGVVYHGHDPVIGRDVAVKTMHLSAEGTGMSREELVGRFQTEARAAGLLTHPNIVVIFDAGEEEGLFYITMEMVEGRSLQTLLDARQLFPLPRVMKMMEQVCSALDFAHQRGVVHRDIKPANLMMTADDTVKITDFGTAKILQFGTAQTAHVMGTPSYMSPEQVKGKPVDGRSDIFSLGVILYELMTGEKPFPGQNITTVIYKIINEEPISPRSLDSSIHPGLSAVITRALAKDPAERYQSCHELLNALKSYHALVGPESTVRRAPVPSQPAPAGSRPAAQGPRAAAAPAAPVSHQLHHPPDLSPQFILPVMVEEESAKKPANLLLTLILLGIIGYSGYRVYPPVLDLWRRAHDTAEAPATLPKAESAAPTAAADPSTVKPETQSNVAPQTSVPLQAAPATTNAAVPVEKSDPREATQSAAVPAAAVKTPEAARTTASGTDNAVAAQKPAPPAAPTPAHVLEGKLHAELAGQPLADKVKIQATSNALTLSGPLTLAEHRELWKHLRVVPAGVRVIDDTEYAEDQNATAAPVSAGWIWARSTPPGATIVVDGAETGLRTPARMELQVGAHEVSLVLQGFGTVHRSVTVNQGQTMQFSETLAVR